MVVEQGFVGARELECGVLESLNGGRPVASEVAEIRVLNESGFYDYRAKYLADEQVELVVPEAGRRAVADECGRWRYERSRRLAVKASPGWMSSSPTRAAS